MDKPVVNSQVRLVQDIPECQLTRGEVGVIRSHWFAPEVAYEVEFRHPGEPCPTRALLRGDQFCVEAARAEAVDEPEPVH